MPQYLWPHGQQQARLPRPSLSPWLCPNLCPLGQWCHPTVSPSVALFSFVLPSVFPSIRVFSSESALYIRWPKYWSFSISIIPSKEYSRLISFRIDWFDFLAIQGYYQESSLTPKFKSISSSVLSLLYDPAVISVHDYWKNHSFDSRTLCLQSGISAFYKCSLGLW